MGSDFYRMGLRFGLVRGERIGSVGRLPGMRWAIDPF